MTREDAKKIFLNRGFINGIYDGDKWREACIVISEWLEQEPKSEWQKDHEILKAYSDGANEMLNKIRAEIEQEIIPRNSDQYDHEAMWQNCGLRIALKVIDKYKGESEE